MGEPWVIQDAAAAVATIKKCVRTNFDDTSYEISVNMTTF